MAKRFPRSGDEEQFKGRRDSGPVSDGSLVSRVVNGNTPSDGRIVLHGVGFHPLDEPTAVDSLMTSLDRGEGGWLVTPNLDILRMTAKDPGFRNLVNRATMVLLDGAPLSWAASIAGRPQIPRTPGSSLMWPLCRRLADVGGTVLLLGGRPGAAEEAALRLVQFAPGLRTEWFCPPIGFEEDPVEWAAVVEAVSASHPDVVICGLGAPKQEKVMSKLAPDFPGIWFLGLGGSIDFAAGLTQRAPAWMRRTGTEWLHRLVHEPRRLYRRYLIEDLPFAFVLLSWALKERLFLVTAGTEAPTSKGRAVLGEAEPAGKG